MTQIDNVKRYMKEKGVFTLPELQLKFGISYLAVRKLVAEMLKNETAEAVGDGYRFRPPSADSPAEYCLFLSEEERIERVKSRFENCRYLCARNSQPDESDELLYKALWICLQSNCASASFIQRKMGIPYARADKIISWMEKMEYVSKAFGPMSRRLLVCKDEYIFTYGNPDNPVLKPEFADEPQSSDSDGEDSEDLCARFGIELDEDDDDEFADEIRPLRDFEVDLGDDEDDEDDEDDDDDGHPTVHESFARFRRRLEAMQRIREERENPDNRDGIEELFRSRADEAKKNEADKTESVGHLASVLGFVSGKRQRPVTGESEPEHNLWPNEKEFADAVMERLKKLIRTDEKMARAGAIKKAELYLEAVRDTHDGKMLQLYERLVYELKACSNYLYNQLRKQVWED